MKKVILLFIVAGLIYSCEQEPIGQPTIDQPTPSFSIPEPLELTGGGTSGRTLDDTMYKEDFAYSAANYLEVPWQDETTPFETGVKWFDLNGPFVPWNFFEAQVYKVLPWNILSYTDFQLHIKGFAHMQFVYPVFDPAGASHTISQLRYRVVSGYNTLVPVDYDVYLFYNNQWNLFAAGLEATGNELVMLNLPPAAQNGTAVGFVVTGDSFDQGIRVSDFRLE